MTWSSKVPKNIYFYDADDRIYLHSKSVEDLVVRRWPPMKPRESPPRRFKEDEEPEPKKPRRMHPATYKFLCRQGYYD